MLESDVLNLVENSLAKQTSVWRDGFELVRPEPLTVLRLTTRPARLHWLPYFGKARSLVLVARQPTDIDVTHDGDTALLRRLALAAESITPLRLAPAVVFTGIVLSPRPIDPEDDARIAAALERPRTGRAVPLGLFRVNPGHEAVAFALRRGPAGLFPEPDTLADAACQNLRRFVPLT